LWDNRVVEPNDAWEERISTLNPADQIAAQFIFDGPVG
jgi:hypothetical protein